MKKYLLLLFVVLGGVSVYAQDTEAAFKRANQQYREPRTVCVPFILIW